MSPRAVTGPGLAGNPGLGGGIPEVPVSVVDQERIGSSESGYQQIRRTIPVDVGEDCADRCLVGAGDAGSGGDVGKATPPRLRYNWFPACL